jgi:hypothetical protein
MLPLSTPRVSTAVLRSLVVVGLLGAVPVGAQGTPGQVDSLRALYRISLPAGFADRSAFVRSLPATNASTPSGFGPQWGDLFMGGGFQRNTRASRPGGPLGANDGAVVAGFGLGNARMIGLEVAFTSFSTFRSGFFTRTGVSLKAHHQFSNGWAMAAGTETAFVLGEAGDGGRSHYVAASRVFTRTADSRRPFSAIGVTLGAGDGRFRTLADVRADRSTVGVFGALSARLTDAVGAVADWNGQDLTLSASVVPLRCLPLTITPGITDVTRNAGTRPRFLVGVGVGVRPDQLGARLRDCL